MNRKISTYFWNLIKAWEEFVVKQREHALRAITSNYIQLNINILKNLINLNIAQNEINR